MNDGCTGDFAFDHLKQQENLSRKTLAELSDKRDQLQKEYDTIVKEQPLLKEERKNIEGVITEQMSRREVITKEYQDLISTFQAEEKRQQEERQRKELAARQDEQRKFEFQLTKTKKTTDRAYTLRKREYEFKTNKEDIEQSLKELRPAIDSVEAHL